jgi:hypothetical protein
MKKGYLRSFGVPIFLLGAHMKKGYLKSHQMILKSLGTRNPNHLNRKATKV